MLGASRDETYNGWRNWDTWNANLWFTSYEPLYRAALQLASRFDDPMDFGSHAEPLLYNGEPWIDDWGNVRPRMLDDIDPDKIDWDEIHASFREE